MVEAGKIADVSNKLMDEVFNNMSIDDDEDGEYGFSDIRNHLVMLVTEDFATVRTMWIKCNSFGMMIMSVESLNDMRDIYKVIVS